MPIEYLGRTGGTTSATPPAHQAGDLLLIFAFRSSSSTIPTLPAGWTSLGTQVVSSWVAMRVGYRIATAPGTTSGTWTNATSVHCLAYRPNGALYTPTASFANASVNPANYPDLAIDAPLKTYARGVVGAGSANYSPPSGWDVVWSGNEAIGTALNVTGDASTVGGNSSPSSGGSRWVAATVGFGVDQASSGDFFMFF